MFYKLTVPITNYEGNGIFFQDMYLQGESCPSNYNWYLLAKANHERDSVYPEYTGDWKEVMNTLFNFKEEMCMPRNMISSNAFLEHPKFGRQPITIERINILNF